MYFIFNLKATSGTAHYIKCETRQDLEDQVEWAMNREVAFFVSPDLETVRRVAGVELEEF